MAIRHQFSLLIHILYCVAIIHGILLGISNDEICDVLCKECNALAVFVNNQCECNFNDDDNKGVECVQRLQRDIQTLLNPFSDDRTNKERSLRSIFKPRRRLRIADAEKVAQYFMNGGASAGHSHFIKGSGAVCDNSNPETNSLLGTVRQGDTEDEFHLPLPTNPFPGSTHKSYDSQLRALPEIALTISGQDIPDTQPNTPILGMARPTFGYPMNRLYPSGPMLGPIVHPYRKHRYEPPFHVPLRTSALPSHILNNLAVDRYLPYYPPMHYDLIGRNLGPRQDDSPTTTPFVGQPYGNNDDFNHQDFKNSSTTENNADESVQGKTSSTSAVGMNALYPPMQYRHLISPYQDIPYHSPLLNVLYSPFDEYISEAVPRYLQHASDSTLTSVQNPNSYYTNNANTEQQDEVLATVMDETANFNDEQVEKTNGTIKHHTCSEEQEET